MLDQFSLAQDFAGVYTAFQTAVGNSSKPIMAAVHIYIYIYGARDGVVVKALCYKPAGRGFDSRWCHWNFSVT